MAHRYLVRPLLTPDYYAAIGRSIVTWAALERNVEDQFLGMLFHRKAAQFRAESGISEIKFAPRSFSERLRIMHDLAPSFYEGETLREIRSIIGRCESLQKHRNRLAHGEWILRYLPRKPPKLLSRLRRNGTDGRERSFTVQQIRTVTYETSAVAFDLFKFGWIYELGGTPSKAMQEFFSDRKKKSRPSARASKPGARARRRLPSRA